MGRGSEREREREREKERKSESRIRDIGIKRADIICRKRKRSKGGERGEIVSQSSQCGKSRSR